MSTLEKFKRSLKEPARKPIKDTDAASGNTLEQFPSGAFCVPTFSHKWSQQLDFFFFFAPDERERHQGELFSTLQSTRKCCAKWNCNYIYSDVLMSFENVWLDKRKVSGLTKTTIYLKIQCTLLTMILCARGYLPICVHLQWNCLNIT